MADLYRDDFTEANCVGRIRKWSNQRVDLGPSLATRAYFHVNCETFKAEMPTRD